MIGSAPGGTVVQVAAAAAMLASDGARGSGGTVNPDDIGKPSQAALAMAERLRQPTVPAAPPNPDELSSAQPDAPATTIEGIRSGFIYYHRTQPLYEPGDRILPGMWGRLVLGTGPAHSSFCREMVWEMVRCAVSARCPQPTACRVRLRGIRYGPSVQVGPSRVRLCRSFRCRLAHAPSRHEPDRRGHASSVGRRRGSNCPAILGGRDHRP
jgi:hypothetical protein